MTKWLPICALVMMAIVLGACASAGQEVASAPTSEKTATAAEVESEMTNSEDVVVYSKQRRSSDCRRKVRRTATRIPRSECETSVFGKAYHMPSDKPDAESAGSSSPH